ncbi:alpha/beta fold hydrolase [Microtetraspora niveoalba]|uniref:alpha/beta fold hydrolase n=1 Tax=Microtetraspora niveoalba TaxID=46175 RepID=UPI0008379606|nr:alpha/beta fold hydrolase [Microtetraspora niveoalba]
MQDPSGLAVRTFVPDRPAAAPPVLLVHGFGSDGEADWVATGVAGALKDAGRTVVVPDLPAHGASPAPGGPAEAGAREIAESLVAALDAALADAGVPADVFDVAGYSLGARLAWELPAAAPGRVRRTVLGGLNPGEPFEALDIEALHRAVADGTEPGDPFTAAIAGMVRSHGERAAGLATCVEGLRATPFAGGAWSGTVPPLFVVGADDVMTQGIERIVEGVDGAQLVTVPGGHFEVLGGGLFRRTVLTALEQ